MSADRADPSRPLSTNYPVDAAKKAPKILSRFVPWGWSHMLPPTSVLLIFPNRLAHCWDVLSHSFLCKYNHTNERGILFFLYLWNRTNEISSFYIFFNMMLSSYHTAFALAWKYNLSNSPTYCFRGKCRVNVISINLKQIYAAFACDLSLKWSLYLYKQQDECLCFSKSRKNKNIKRWVDENLISSI